MPSSYLTGKHGARAAYEMLQASGYNVQRWEQPLSDLAARADTQTVVIFAEPILTSTGGSESSARYCYAGRQRAGHRMVGRRTCAGRKRAAATQFQSACKLTPQGLDPLAGSGEVWMVPEASWGLTGRSTACNTTAPARRRWWSTPKAKAR